MKLADSSCLVCVFAEINRPFILLDWMKHGYQIVITEQVHEELKTNETTNKLITPEIKNGNINVNNFATPQELSVFRARYPSLGLGEASIILAALKLRKTQKRHYAILDDLGARKVASKLGANLTGTYGLLKTLKEKGHIDDVTFNQCKQDMQKSKFRINFDKIS